MNLPYPLADASQSVQANFEHLATQLASLQQAQPPPGAIFAYGADSAPNGYLLCDGSAVSRTAYSALFTILGTVHGAGDGSTTFNVPDLRGRQLNGKGTMVDVDTVGKNDGRAVASRFPAHAHGDSHTHTFTTGTSPTFTAIFAHSTLVGAGSDAVGLNASTSGHAHGGTTDGRSTISTDNANDAYYVVQFIIKI